MENSDNQGPASGQLALAEEGPQNMQFRVMMLIRVLRLEIRVVRLAMGKWRFFLRYVLVFSWFLGWVFRSTFGVLAGGFCFQCFRL